MSLIQIPLFFQTAEALINAGNKCLTISEIQQHLCSEFRNYKSAMRTVMAKSPDFLKYQRAGGSSKSQHYWKVADRAHFDACKRRNVGITDDIPTTEDRVESGEAATCSHSVASTSNQTESQDLDLTANETAPGKCFFTGVMFTWCGTGSSQFRSSLCVWEVFVLRLIQ